MRMRWPARRTGTTGTDWTCDAVLARHLAADGIRPKQLVPFAELTRDGSEGAIEPAHLAPLRGHPNDATINVDRRDGRAAIRAGSIQLGGGHTYMSGFAAVIDGRRVDMAPQIVLLGQALAETLLVAIVGTPVHRIVDHPCLRVDGLDVVGYRVDAELTVLTLPVVDLRIARPRARRR